MAWLDKFTTSLQTALADAQSTALSLDNPFIEPPHVMQALLEQNTGTVKPLLAQAGVNVSRLQTQLSEAIRRLSKVEGVPGEIHISADLNRLLNISEKLAQEKGDSFISSEWFVLAAVEDKGELGRLLKDNGANKTVVKQTIDQIRGGRESG